MPGAYREEFGGEVETPKCERATKWLEYLNMKERRREKQKKLNFNFYSVILTRDAKLRSVLFIRFDRYN